ncbi:MAG: ankyrin repeat domain-containing protein [Phycisphaerales bacterium]|nr:MAG: ankyrin repeat domain-containing protein [Phycisphaerales bacterium]
MADYLTQITNYLLMQSWQIAILVVVIAAVTLTLKNRSAHVRYLLWLIVLAKCLVPPLLTVPVAVLPQEELAEQLLVSPVQMPIVAQKALDRTLAESPVSLATSAAAEPAPTVAETPAKLTLRQWLGFGWLAGVAVFLILAVIKALRTNRRLRRQRKTLPVELQSTIENVVSDVGVRAFPKVWLLEGIGQPFVWGLLRGNIYLPANFAEIDSAEHRRGVLGHELSHVRRFDAAVNLVQIVVQGVFWFHPFVWWANKNIRAEREKCCDEITIARLGARAKDYSGAIVKTLMTEYESNRPVPSLAVAGPVKNIEERIKTIMKPEKKFYNRPSIVVATTVLLLTLFTVPTALVLTARGGTEAVAEEKVKLTRSMHEAVAKGDIEQVSSIISQGVDINARTRAGVTPLHQAAKWGQKAVIELLLAQGASIDARDSSGYTPLHHAVSRGRQEVTDLLISKGAYIDATSKDGNSLVFAAMSADETDSAQSSSIARLLVSKGAGVSPIHWAAFVGDVEKVQELLRQGVDVDSRNARLDDGTPLYFAVTGAHEEVIRLLLAKGADVNLSTRRGETSLNAAARRDARTGIAELLIEHGADVNFRHAKWGKDDTALHTAAFRGHVEMARLLVNRGGNVNMLRGPNGFATTPLDRVFFGAVTLLRKARADASFSPGSLSAEAREALRNLLKDRRAVADVLLSAGARVNGLSSSALAVLARGDGCEMAELLFAHGLNPNSMVSSAYGVTLLHVAADAGSKGMVELLIAKGADVNARDTDDGTPLWYAKDKGHTDIVQLLIKHGARSETPVGALLDAARDGNIKQVRSLVERGADTNVRDYRGRTPLHLAAARGYTDIAELLVKGGADINAKSDTAEATALILAIQNGHTDTAKLLVAKGAEINAKGVEGQTALHCAAKLGDVGIGKILVSEGAQTEAKCKHGATPLAWAAYEGQAEFAALLIAHGADIEAKLPDGQTTPLCCAIAQGHLDIAKVLLAKGAKADVRPLGRTLVHVAMHMNHQDMVRLLLTEGLQIPPIHEAAYFGDLDTVARLVKDGTKVNASDEAGYMPLHCALCGGHKETVRFLLSKGADVNAKTTDERTPLCLAQTVDMATLLITEGADARARVEFGHTVLHSAADQGDPQIVELLLARGANVDSKAKSTNSLWKGWTPLHVACNNGHKAVVETLLAKDVDINAKTDKGDTPMSLAKRNGHREVAELLVRRAVKDFVAARAQRAKPGKSWLEGTTTTFTIPKKNMEIPEQMQSCAANLRKIYTAIKEYEENRGELPDRLSDLVPRYLSRDMLLCPHNPVHNTRNYPDPKMPCSYIYEFSVAGRGGPYKGMTTREHKIGQMRLFGGLVPLVRCRMHGHMWLALTVDGRVYLNQIMWEYLFMPDYIVGQEMLD